MKSLVRIVLASALSLLLLLTGCRRTETVLHPGDIFQNPTQLELLEVLAKKKFARADAILKTEPVDLPGTNGGTILWWQAYVGNYDAFLYLLERGANPNALVSDTINTMEFCAERSDPRFLQSAIKHGGKANLVGTFSGQTPIYSAILSGPMTNILILISNGADLNFSDYSGETPLTLALGGNQFDYAVLLLNHGADPTKRNRAGFNAYDFLAQWQRGSDHPLHQLYTNAVRAFEEKRKTMVTNATGSTSRTDR
jgi:ankyrin repeat protein